MTEKQSNYRYHKRVTVYISDEDYRKLKSKLALQGLTISEWFRKMALKEPDDPTTL